MWWVMGSSRVTTMEYDGDDAGNDEDHDENLHPQKYGGSKEEEDSAHDDDDKDYMVKIKDENYTEEEESD